MKTQIPNAALARADRVDLSVSIAQKPNCRAGIHLERVFERGLQRVLGFARDF